MSKITPTTLAALNQMHLQYCDFNQKVRSDDKLMAELGHPSAAAFRELRAFFDSLSYACNSSARWFTFKNKFEKSQFWAPNMDVSWYPTGDLARFGHIYPAKPEFEDYLKAAAAAGWPDDVAPKLEGGSWIIETQSVEMREKFLQLKETLAEPGRFTVKTQVDEETEQAYYYINIYLYGVDRALPLQAAILAILREFHSDYVLPARLPEQDSMESAPLPMSAKKFMHGNVKEVTVTDRHVLVPLIAIPADPVVVGGHVHKIEALLAQGFPFAEAAAWLEKVLVPKSFKSLKKQYS